MARAAVYTVVLGVLATLLVPGPAAANSTSDAGPVQYLHPVEAPVIDPFRAPPSPYGPGNRGLEYGTAPGDPIGAAAAGEVIFAGPVAHSLHVTVAHADGRLTSYSFLDEITVRVGERVETGTLVGTAAGPVHVSLRENGEYLDPALFFGVEKLSVRLIPENPAGTQLWSRADEAMQLALLARLEGGGWGIGGLAHIGRGVTGLVSASWQTALALAPAVLDAAGVLARISNPAVLATALVQFGRVLKGLPPAFQLLLEANPVNSVFRIAHATKAWIEHRFNCTPNDVVPDPPDERRMAVLVAGLDSTSEGAAISDIATDQLGYDPADVVGFSYAGGRTPGPLKGEPNLVAPELADIPVRPYDRSDSSQDLLQRGAHLADLLEDMAQATPGVPIDLYAHSQGGVVVRLALADLAARPGGDEVLESLGLVATLGSPHGGADLATMATAAGGTPLFNPLLVAVDHVLDTSASPQRSTNLVDLSLGSATVEQLARTRLPEGPQYLSLAARGDLVVLPERSKLRDATIVVLPIDGFSAHSDLPGHAWTHRELSLALAGHPPTCVGALEFLDTLLVVESNHVLVNGIGFGIATLWFMSP